MKVMANSEYLDRLKPIKEYDFISGEKLIIIDERFSVSDDGYVGFGYIDDNAGTLYPTLFNYNLENDKVTVFYGVANGMRFELIDDQLVSYQSNLYTHILTLTAGANNYVLMYDCTSSYPINSVGQLRTLMNINSTSDSVVLPIVNLADLSTAGLQVTTTLCKIETANVTAVTDKVTAKS